MSIVRVKPLQWQDFDGMGAKANAMLIVSYLITKWSDGEFRVEISAPGYSALFDGTHIHPTLEAAKSAAQADYVARILSAIEVAPTDTHASDAAIAGLKSMGEPE